VDRLDASPGGTFAYHPNGALKQLPGRCVLSLGQYRGKNAFHAEPLL